jgi:hypothetical protein
MKKSLLTLIATMSLFAATKVSAVFTNDTVLTANFLITAISVTNSTPSKVTNSFNTITSTIRATTNLVSSANILKMIATEFNTNFPAGSRLAFTTGLYFVVVDSTGKVLLNASSNPDNSQYYFGLSNNIVTESLASAFMSFGKQIEYINGNKKTAPGTIMASDYFICYRDSHTNDFHFGGFVSYTNFRNSTPSSSIDPSVTFKVTGSGGGYMIHPKTLQPTYVVFPKADMTASGRNVHFDVE